MSVKAFLNDDIVRPSACLSRTSTLNLHSADGAAVSYDANISMKRGFSSRPFREINLLLPY